MSANTDSLKARVRRTLEHAKENYRHQLEELGVRHFCNREAFKEGMQC